MRKIFLAATVVLSLTFGYLLHGLNAVSFSTTDLPLDLITLIGGGIAFLVYYKQKYDSKKDIANIIYLEIIQCENLMKQFKEDLERGGPPENFLRERVLENESWTRNKYLFVRDFSPQQWEAITEFYRKAKLFDEAVLQNISYFQKNEEQIRINLQKTLAEYVKEIPIEMSKIATDKKEKANWAKFVEMTENFTAQFLNRVADQNSIFFYKPQKPINDVIFYLNNTDLEMSQSLIGEKLRKLAGIKE